MQKTIVAFGEILWDLLPGARTLGGAPFNFVYRADCLGERGIIVSRLGRDELGREAFEAVRALGMATDWLQWDATYPTGTVHIGFDQAGNPDFLIVPGVAYDHVEATQALLEVAAEADCICFGTLAQRSAVSRETCWRIVQAAEAAVKLLDINLRPDCYTTETIRDSLAMADVLKLNDDEARQLDETLDFSADGSLDALGAELVRRWSLACCVITLGERGALGFSDDGQTVYTPGYRVGLVDPLGAGDAFTAGFVHKYLRGEALPECCRYGNALGAIVASQQGATGPLSRQDVERFLAGRPQRVADPAFEQFTAA